MADNIVLGYMTFPGIEQVERGSFTLSHGITPSIATIEIQPQEGFVTIVGPMVITQGDVTLVFPNCRLDSASFQYNQSGMIWRLSIMDRRWKWAFGAISGHYNQRFNSILPFGSIDAFTLKSPQELCSLCLDAMGETGYDVSQVPNEPRPQTDWEAEIPAQALASLAESLGCRIVLRLDNTVQVARVGVGEGLPTDGIEADGMAVSVFRRPDKLRFLCGPTRYQVDFKLEAVGLDVDGLVKPIDDLSYAPQGVPGVVSFTPGGNIINGTAFAMGAYNDTLTCTIGADTSIPTVVAKITQACNSSVLPGFRSFVYWTDGAVVYAQGVDTTVDMSKVNAAASGTATITKATVAATIPAGWGNYAGTSPPDFMDIVGWETPIGTPPPAQLQLKTWFVNPRELARASVFRWYRISMEAVDDPNLTPLIPGFGDFPGQRIQARWQILPCEDVQVEGFYDEDRNFQSFPAWVWGVSTQGTFWGGWGGDIKTSDGNGNSLPGQFVETTFSVDKEIGVVKFDEPVYKNVRGNPDWTIAPADLYVRLAVSVKDYASNAPYRYYKDLDFPNPVGTQPRYLLHDEEKMQIAPIYDADYNVVGLKTTSFEVDPAADYYLNAVSYEYQLPTPQDITYLNVLPISPDGAIQQVTWTVDATSGCGTRASRNTEWNPIVPAFRERLMLARMAVLSNFMPQILTKVRGK